MGSSTTTSAVRNPSAALATFIDTLAFDDLPADAVRIAERCFIDTLGVAVVGTTTVAGRTTAETIRETHKGGPATILRGGQEAPIPEAAFANGAATHALDYDDVTDGMDGHPSATMVAPILNLAETLQASGEEMLTAYVCGFETQCYLAAPNLRNRSGPGLHLRGWHPTSIFGTFGATAAAASLLDLDVEETQHALNIAASMASGLRINFGSLSKPMHAGNAGANGVRAAYLAKHGLTADESAIAEGLLPVYHGLDADWHEELYQLGSRWALLEDGVDIKTYPSCYATHSGIFAAESLAAEHDITPETIAEVRLTVSETMDDLLPFDDPGTESQAKFSIPYAIASAIAFDRVTIETFTPDYIRDPGLQRVRERVHYEVDPTLRTGTPCPTTVAITTTSGTTHSKTVDRPPGSGDEPLSDADLRAKFFECTSGPLCEETARSAYDLLRDLRTLADPGDLVAALSTAE